ncbi:MAG: hypothetical protein EBZ77_15340 [Chitinophagia bacterium]|nr:hypothetical protein [Chitinophagia bacterium]
MAIDLSLATAFRDIFGYNTDAFEPEVAQFPARAEAGKAGSAPYYQKDAVTKREYFLPVKLTYIDASQETKELWLPHPVLSVSVRKNVVETPLTERRGTVKEIINIQDYQIKIRGLALITTRDFPEDAIADLREVFEAKRTVQISNAITDIFLLRTERRSSDDVLITSFALPETRGVKNVRAYEMDLVSDEPFNLIDLS